jgi:hypothetical protein
MHRVPVYYFLQLEKQVRELMEEKDTVQSQLNCLLKSDVDDHGDDRTAKRWVLSLSYTQFKFCITVS